VSQFLSYAVPGIPFGCSYAIVAVGLVLTYQTTGVFNFGFGAQAYTSALLFTILVDRGVGTWAAFVVAVVVVAPLIGLVLERFLFRHIAPSNVTGKVVSAVAVFVALPELLAVVFGSAQRFAPPTLFFDQGTVYLHLLSTPINGLELETLVVTALVVLLVAAFRSTPLGLQMRGAVESPRLLELECVRADRVSASAWMFSSFLAGLAGVLLAPQYPTVQSNDYAILLVAAVAASALGGLANIPLALVGGLVLGVVGGLGSGYFPASSIWHTGLLPAVPFLLLAVLLVGLPRLSKLDSSHDPLAVVDPPPPAPITATRAPQIDRAVRVGGRVLLVAGVVSVLTWVPGNWAFTLTSGLVFSVIFLSITLVTGLGGQLSLCQATFAGVGAFTAAQLALHAGLPVLFGAVVGAAAAMVIGALAALPALRLRGLPLALLTLSLALLADNVVFPIAAISGPTTGLVVPRPQIGPINLGTESTKAFFVLALVILVLCALAVRRFQRGTLGRFLAAMRTSPLAAASIGIDLNRTKVVVFALSAALAGLGGALYGSLQQSITPVDFNYQFSLIFVVVVATTGVATVEGAIQAGMGFVVIQQLLSYLPGRAGGPSLAVVLFALAALGYAAHPEGVVEYQKRRATQWLERRLRFRSAGDDRRSGLFEPTVVAVDEGRPG
jgi:ABC-type branched-subunit amino acid transport system permease subunit